MLWACILLPQLALDGVLRGHAEPDQPLVLLGGPSQRRVLKAANRAARGLGLRAGQPLSTAQALAQGFETADYPSARLAEWEQLLAAWAYGYSGQVSLHYPRALLLEVGSSLGLFGPWPVFEARLREGLNELGFSHRIALAPNPVAARVLAGACDGAAVHCAPALLDHLEPLAVDRVGLAPEQAQLCQRMGLRRLGQVLALPRDALARRFPRDLLLQLDRLRGLAPLPLAFYQPPERFRGRIEFNFDVENTASLVFPLRRLIDDLGAFLVARDGGVQRFVLRLEHAEGAPTKVPVGLLAPERAPLRLLELARGRLEPVQVARPVKALALYADELPAFVPAHSELFGPRAQQLEPWGPLRERLRARLGDDAVQGLGYVADHRPERAWQPGPGVLALPGGLRPGWLLPAPCELPEASPSSGPERLESGWWDGADVRRDYYRVVLPDGREGWAYREVGTTSPWWLQGLFG
ncbi:MULTISPECIES: DNA polymerase Y family protein [unclassified Pseudomonas]|uniref:Y-family DNA polymerase n=1 Tax=unclassified Pseudomonas TaxID=196821 RepID=UPI000BC4EBEC|nr:MULTISPECIES: DNA polymerase Y family protein [unclassified Pseudomonas]PVZ20112.1 protein ImuB [Pseudomonas sp. URIL14HWK12:I12]PVZ27178.1 protein ImuB [Pseudomonas sp. URIL14HWK12:I10]PVZ38067.1 protein ImuB [Pseudomonas sp. URIL14HWK12:I11]SNZ04659.1 protein ImuB [Pseudomonas sp. URIL14HWK12:I9]